MDHSYSSLQHTHIKMFPPIDLYERGGCVQTDLRDRIHLRDTAGASVLYNPTGLAVLCQSCVVPPTVRRDLEQLLSEDASQLFVGPSR